jgi:hypothetical protein
LKRLKIGQVEGAKNSRLAKEVAIDLIKRALMKLTKY